MSCTGFKPRKPIFKKKNRKVDFRNISKNRNASKKLKFDEDSNTDLDTNFWKVAIIVASHEIFPLPFGNAPN